MFLEKFVAFFFQNLDFMACSGYDSHVADRVLHDVRRRHDIYYKRTEGLGGYWHALIASPSNRNAKTEPSVLARPKAKG